jgi:uncharacterized protein
MTSPAGHALACREFHSFQAAGREFVYLVPNAAVFELDDAASAILTSLRRQPLPFDQLVQQIDLPESVVAETAQELLRVRAIGPAGVPDPPQAKQLPPENFPLTTMVLNVTNQCNLSCAYCYEYGEDKSSTPKMAASQNS